MKQFFYIITALFLFVGLPAQGQNRQIFQGTISYNLQMSFNDYTMETKATCYYSDKHSKISTDIYGVGIQVIRDFNLDSATMLMNVMGKKIALRIPNPQENDTAEMNIGELLSTDTLCGYICQKYSIFHGSLTDSAISALPSTPFTDLNILKNTEVNMWASVCQDLSVKNTLFSALPIPQNEAILQMCMEQNNMKITITATEVKAGKISNKEFQIDKSYQYTTLQKLQQMLDSSNTMF